VSRKD